MRRIVGLVFVLAALASPAFAQANLQGDVARARAQYPTPMSAAQQAAVVNEVAWLHRAEGWAVLGKPGGNNCPQPRTGTPLSCDFLVYKPTLSGFDVLSDAEGAGRVQWDGPKPGVLASQVVEAVEPEGSVEPPPPPPPPPPPSGAATTELQQQQLLALMQIIQRLDVQLEAQRQQGAALAAAIVDLKAQIASGVKIRF